MDLLFPLLSCGLVGILAGILAGLLGISGGIVTVPALYLIFRALHFPHEQLMQFAIGTSLASMIFNALSASYSHNKRHAVLWPVVKHMMPGIIVGSVVGALVAHVLPEGVLEIIFGTFACLLGVWFFLTRKMHEGDHPLPHFLALNGLGFGIAGISNVLGIGGGIITVPSLMAFKVPEKKAIGTSAATGCVISFFGAIAYLYFGIGQVHAPYSIGYLYLPAFIVISVTTFFAAPFGADLAHRLSSSILKKIFGCALILTGLTLIFL